jgi:peptidyl-prolyl cis-trans isomerase C
MHSVVFDGVEIPASLIAQEAQNHPEASATEAWEAAGHALALRALLLDRARDLGLTAEPELDDEGREETSDEALIRVLLDQELQVTAPTTAECRRVYEAERQRFRTPPLYEASHILIEAKGEDPQAHDAARAVAARLIEILGRNQTNFAELAADHSDCPSAGLGGSLGQLRPGDLAPEVEAALIGLAPGETAAEPVLSRFGWHILRLDRRIEGRELPFEAVEERIRLHLESRAWTAAAAIYAADLAAQARARGVALSLTPQGDVSAGSATLGDFLADGRASARLGPWLAAADPGLAERLAQAAEAAGETVADFVQAAVTDFLDTADDERWTNLISAARDAPDPALACLASLLRSKIEPARRTFTVIRRT